ncbi:TRAP transporter substrate-binding protein [Halomonas organivorans]|uniref:TRAP-type mannitol/chloroaromatic compound transport system substrate-binding protein n=1 Tax=Halomonas organivorans TaxID=257772 RepID=A0A7W5BV31_9GAMM|nr:TRAP transporter substrate-binding protein [Halomonas organivorans]MBB3139590.1 TRAP-type mannitol/chloroaromatic compound transport system substrate-binding protein [Halomonas organivorans]
MNKTLTPSIAIVGAVLASSGALAQTLTLQSAFPFSLEVIDDSIHRFVEDVETATGGELSFTPYDAGAFSPPFEILANVGNGSLDAGWSAASYWAGQLPAAALFQSIPFGPDVPQYLAWLYGGGGIELWEELYRPYNVVPIPCGSMISEAGGWYVDEITGVDDLNGMSVRISGLGGEAMSRLGVSPVSLPAGETFLGLDTGRIGGAELSFPTIDTSVGFQEVANHYYFPGWHQPGSLNELIVNADVWDGLSEGQRQAVRHACSDLSIHMYAQDMQAQSSALQEFRQAGVEVARFPEAVLEALRGASTEVLAENAAEDDDFRRVLESYRAFSERYEEYRELTDF